MSLRSLFLLACCLYPCIARRFNVDKSGIGGDKDSKVNTLKTYLLASSPMLRAQPSRLAASRHSIPAHPAVQRRVSNQPAMALEGVGKRIVQGASQGAVGAVVAAGLSAFTEPVVNRVLVNRVPVMQSIKELDVNKSKEFFKTTLPTNFLKFPLFEAVNAVMQIVALPEALKGAITGIVFTTLTLPVTNYRFAKSMGFPVTSEALTKAYLPTVVRDILYGISRNKLWVAMSALYPALFTTAVGRSLAMFPIVYGACLLSSPGNELRGYYLQPKDKRKSFKDFFNLTNYARSTFIGALIMGISLVLGNLATIPLERLFFFLRDVLLLR